MGIGGNGTGGAANGCIDDGTCDFQVETCDCADCKGEALCGACMTDGMCTIDDACTCPDCWTDTYCGDASKCKDDGVCDDYAEGCICADCKGAANCADYVPPDAGM
jgi:hypothetical protein